MSRTNYDDELVVADKMAGGVVGLAIWGLALLARGVGPLAQDLFEPTHAGVLVGHKRGGWQKAVTIPWPALLRHVHLLGATGSGKTTLLKTIGATLFAHGCGVCVISPKADLIEELLPHVLPERVDDVILFDATDTVRPLAFNVLETVKPRLRSRAASELLTTFKRFYAGDHDIGIRTEHFLRFSLLTLLDCPGTTLASIPRLLMDDGFRQQVLSHVSNPAVLNFWEWEYAALSAGQRAQAIQPILTRVASILAYPQVYALLAQPQSSFQTAEVMDQGRILLVNLPQGILGEDVSAFLGGLLINKLQLTAAGRAALPPEKRRPYYLLIDELQNFGSDATFIKIFTEARAFGLALLVANQYPEQLAVGLREAVEHNVAVSLTCQVERGGHTVLYREPQDPSKVDKVLTPPRPLGPGRPEVAREIVLRSRQRYGRSRAQRERAQANAQGGRNDGPTGNISFYQAP